MQLSILPASPAGPASTASAGGAAAATPQALPGSPISAAAAGKGSVPGGLPDFIHLLFDQAGQAPEFAVASKEGNESGQQRLPGKGLLPPPQSASLAAKGAGSGEKPVSADPLPAKKENARAPEASRPIALPVMLPIPLPMPPEAIGMQGGIGRGRPKEDAEKESIPSTGPIPRQSNSPAVVPRLPAAAMAGSKDDGIGLEASAGIGPAMSNADALLERPAESPAVQPAEAAPANLSPAFSVDLPPTAPPPAARQQQQTGWSAAPSPQLGNAAAPAASIAPPVIRAGRSAFQDTAATPEIAAKAIGKPPGVSPAAPGGAAPRAAALHPALPASTVIPVLSAYSAGSEMQPTGSPAVHAVPGAAYPGEIVERMDGAGLPAAVPSSGPHAVSVGVSDPLHGYVEIRTQAAAGSITASLGAATAEAHAGLLGHVPALGEYLAGHGVRVGSVSVERSWTGSGGQGQSPYREGGQPPQQNQPQRQSQTPSRPRLEHSVQPAQRAPVQGSPDRPAGAQRPVAGSRLKISIHV